jgi:hypothetical protein
MKLTFLVSRLRTTAQVPPFPRLTLHKPQRIAQAFVVNNFTASGHSLYFARIRLFFALCSSSHNPSNSISGGT